MAMSGRLLGGLALAAVMALPAAAQRQAGDDAWSAGRYEEARGAYARVLAEDPQDVRANLRLGILLSWDGQLDSALVLLTRARAAEPDDADIGLAQARVLGWHARFAEAVALYDTLLAGQPALREAAVGRARTLSWWGRLDDAERGYADILAVDSTATEARLGLAQVNAWRGALADAERQYRRVLAADALNVDALVGLGYVYQWQGRNSPAARLAREALAADSGNRGARKLDLVVRRATRPTVETGANWSNDSDRNTNFWQTVNGGGRVGDAVRVFGSAAALEASDPIREATRIGGEAGLTATVGNVQLTGAGGARRLTPGTAASRTAATYRARGSWRPVPRLGLNAGYARYPFDETALLIERDLDLESLEGGADVRLADGLSVYGSAGGTWLSDGNYRSNASAGMVRTFRRRFSIGASGRTLGYDRRGVGYFSPDRFRLLEGVVGYSLEGDRWDGHVSAGLGAQQIGRDGVAQSEWHVEARLGRRWGAGNRIEGFGGVTNSALSSTSGAFRYRTAGVSLKLGL